VGAISVLCIHVEFLHGVEVGAFLVVMQYVHDVVDGAERVCFIKKVLCEAGGWAIVVEGTSMLFVAQGKPSTSLSHIVVDM
jgi:hypothetical protein